jgi:hypothetical protein
MRGKGRGEEKNEDVGIKYSVQVRSGRSGPLELEGAVII